MRLIRSVGLAGSGFCRRDLESSFRGLVILDEKVVVEEEEEEDDEDDEDDDDDDDDTDGTFRPDGDEFVFSYPKCCRSLPQCLITNRLS